MNSNESPWQRVVSAALVGTERQPFTVPTATGRLGQLLSQLGHLSTEAALLTTAGILSLHQRVGWLPRKYPASTSEACANLTAHSESLLRCSPRAARYLQQMLQGEYSQVLPEWLAIANREGQRVPELFLPELLDWGKQRRDLRAAILQVLGQRGCWLAAQNPDWCYAVNIATEADWETGGQAARLFYLQDLRSHHPDRARELLQATWSQEAVGNRAKFLATLRIGLSMADEPFLETVLGDRSKDVRRIAAELLASLPESRLCQRMIEYLKPLIQLKQETESAQAMEVSLPTICDASMQRDGIELKPRGNLGERAWWLLQLVGATPLDFWQQHCHVNRVEAVISLAQTNDWSAILQQGWQLASQRQLNRIWAQALLPSSENLDQENLKLILDVLTPEQRDDYACHLFQTRSVGINDPHTLTVVLILGQSPIPWSHELASLVLQSVSTYGAIGKPSLNRWTLRNLLEIFALRTPSNFLQTAISRLLEITAVDAATQTSAMAESIDLPAVFHPALMILQFRQEMIQSFDLSHGG